MAATTETVTETTTDTITPVDSIVIPTETKEDPVNKRNKPTSTPPPTAKAEVPIAIVAPVVIPEPVLEVTDTSSIDGKGLMPMDALYSEKMEEALAVLREPISTPDEIAEAQAALYGVLAGYLIRKSDEEVRSFLDKFMAYAVAHLGDHFSIKKRFRGVNALPGITNAQRMEFEMLLKILLDLAPEKTRQSTAANLNWASAARCFVPNTAERLLDALRTYFG